MKICDFGWSIDTKLMRETFCGTPLYVSPELLKKKYYDNKVDIWGLGIMTYELLLGKVPFEIFD
jgi:aurora kinase